MFRLAAVTFLAVLAVSCVSRIPPSMLDQPTWRDDPELGYRETYDQFEQALFQSQLVWRERGIMPSVGKQAELRLMRVVADDDGPIVFVGHVEILFPGDNGFTRARIGYDGQVDELNSLVHHYYEREWVGDIVPALNVAFELTPNQVQALAEANRPAIRLSNEDVGTEVTIELAIDDQSRVTYFISRTTD